MAYVENFVPALVFELVDRLHEADVPLLNQVEKLKAAVRIFLRDADDEAEVGLDELRLRTIGQTLPFANVLVRSSQPFDVEL